MEIVNRDPDRAKALGSALSVEGVLDDAQLKSTWWVVGQLREMKSDEANAVLDHAATQIEQKYPNVRGVAETEEVQKMHGVAAGLRQALPPGYPAK